MIFDLIDKYEKEWKPLFIIMKPKKNNIKRRDGELEKWVNSDE